MNTLNHITKVKIYEIQSFLDIPRKLSPLETLHIAFKSHHINFIYNQMDKTEQDCIKSMLDSYDNPVLINEDIKHKCNLSERLGFIFRTSTNTFMVDTHYLNQINTHVFANHYQNKVQDEDGQLLIQQLDQLDKELFNAIQHTSLKDYLSTLKSKSLQDILKFYQIKSPSKIKKSDAVNLIHDTFFKDDTLLENVFNHFKPSSLFMLHQIIKGHTNYNNNIDLAATVAEQTNLHTVSDVLDHLFIFNYNERHNIISIPYDALDFIQNYINNKGGIETFLSQQEQHIASEDNQVLETLRLYSKDTAINDDNVSSTTVKEDIKDQETEVPELEIYMDPEIRQNLAEEQLIQFKNDKNMQQYITPFNIYFAITNLYGYASLERVVHLMKHLYNRDMTEKDIIDEIEAMNINQLVIVQNEMLLHPVIPMLANSDEIDDPLKGFYEPSHLDELLIYANNEFYTRNTKLKQFIKFLRNNIKEDDDVKKEKTVRYILFHLRIAPDEAHAVEMMNNLIKQNKLLPIPDKKLSKQIEKGWTHLRLWSLRGYTVNETKSL